MIVFNSENKILIYGIGNVGRQDDGLGIKLIEKLAPKVATLTNITLEANYQLNIEDALLIADFDQVLFIDAAKPDHSTAPFSLLPVRPAAINSFTFTSHALSISSVLTLCNNLYHKNPAVWILAIPGYAWEINEELSQSAANNLDQAYTALLNQFKII